MVLVAASGGCVPPSVASRPLAGEGMVSSLTVGSVVLSLAARRAALRAAARAFAASMAAVLSSEAVVVPLGGVSAVCVCVARRSARRAAARAFAASIAAVLSSEAVVVPLGGRFGVYFSGGLGSWRVIGDGGAAGDGVAAASRSLARRASICACLSAASRSRRAVRASWRARACSASCAFLSAARMSPLLWR